MGSAEIFDNSILAEDIADGTVTGARIAENAVGREELAISSVDKDHVEADAVRFFHIEDGEVTSRHFSPAVVGGDHLADISAVWVECSNGNCDHIDLEVVCDFAEPNTLEAIALTCNGAAIGDQTLQCGEDNHCSGEEVSFNKPLSNFCPDSAGVEAIVFCLRD